MEVLLQIINNVILFLKEDFYKIITEIVLFLIASYFIFYKKFIEKLGKYTDEVNS
jgi:hypothetical protein